MAGFDVFPVSHFSRSFPSAGSDRREPAEAAANTAAGNLSTDEQIPEKERKMKSSGKLVPTDENIFHLFIFFFLSHLQV